MRRRLPIAGLLLLVTGVAACSAAPRTAAAPHTTAPHTTAVSSAPAPTPTPCYQQVVTWRNSPGWGNFTATETDIQDMAKAFKAGRSIAKQGRHLSADAHLAYRTPPPECLNPGGSYQRAMADYAAAGEAAAKGNYTRAARMLDRADTQFEKVSAAMKVALGG